MTAEEVVLDELGNYYNADVLPCPMDLLRDDDADQSARRIVLWHRSRAPEVAELLRRLASNPHDEMFVIIERQTLMGWNGDQDEWRVFERLTRRMAATVDRLLAQPADDRQGPSSSRSAPIA